MKTLISILFFTFFSNGFVNGQEVNTSILWDSLLNKNHLVDYFSGIFNRLGIVVEETNERFTVIHHSDHFDIIDGVVKDSVDYIVHLKMENILNMQKHGSDGMIDENESFRIMAVLFTPLTEASLSNPMLTRPVMRKLSGIENHILVNLISPDKIDTICHTLIYINKNWIVVPGKYGDPVRTFNLTPQDAIEYQRKVFIALQANSSRQWKEFKKWYLVWRENVSFLNEVKAN